MAEFNVGDKVIVNNVYASKWQELDGSEKNVRGHLGTIKGFHGIYIEVEPIAPVVGGWNSPYYLLAEELDSVEAHPLTN